MFADSFLRKVPCRLRVPQRVLRSFVRERHGTNETSVLKDYYNITLEISLNFKFFLSITFKKYLLRTQQHLHLRDTHHRRESVMIDDSFYREC